MRNLLFFLFFQLTTSLFIQAQVSGVVKEGGSDKEVKGAQVLINNTSISTTTNGNGQFLLEGMTPGFVEIVVYKDEYQIFRSPLRIQEGKAFKLNLKLTRRETVSKPSTRADQGVMFEHFKSDFLGTLPSASRCKIVNPQALQFSEGSPANITLNEPLVVENPAVGYRITYYLDNVEVALPQALWIGVVKFDTLIPKNKQQLDEWKHGREDLFFGSRRHLFWSLVNGRTDQGFELLDEKGKPLPVDSLLRPSKIAGYRRIKFPGKTEVGYHREKKDMEAPISWIASQEAFDVNAEGIPLNEKSFEITGAMNPGLAGWLPSNYFPVARMNALEAARDAIKLVQEKIYVQTDKPYYYPGEVMWLKGYVNYYEPHYRDSLSRVMYIELITPEQEIVRSRILKIDRGSANGDFIFPDSLKAGNYYLRAYTHLMRNFGDANLFVKTIPVVDMMDKVDNIQAAEKPGGSTGLSMVADKPRYKVREKISMSLKLVDIENKPVAASLSISVTDASQVVAIPEIRITQDFPFKNDPKGIPMELKYTMESGISFAGQFFNDKGKKEKTTVTIVQGKFEDVITRDTDGQGYFVENGYEFYDSMDFSIQGKNAKGKPYGRVEISKREIPDLNFTRSEMPLKVVTTKAPQRVISEYEVPREARILQEVTVSAKKLQTSEFVSRRYGQASRIFGKERLFGADMLGSLLSTIPGLKVNYAAASAGITQTKTLTFGHQNKAGSVKPSEPLVYVNDVFRGGGRNIELQQGPGAVDALESINPAIVDHVEVINTPNSTIAAEGGSGLIAIYTKPGTDQKKTFDKVKLPGFYQPRIFQSPDYDNPATDKSQKDYRSTLYWNPEVKTDKDKGEAALTFFAADLPGRYKVVVEGVTEKGEPVRSESYIDVR